ncbi:hypothetical protein PUN28_001165 [Cardiocondyla obscurior]|uniref:peptidyl-tRNA hydrolase n=1 Tax=Cardiocondyla obscurior TaxID=286306 RepID=A0AAW2H3V5_9HYME
MKCQNKKNGKRRGNNKFKGLNKLLNRKKLKRNSKWEIIYNEQSGKFRFVKKQNKKNVELNEYVFYSVLNTEIVIEFGLAAKTITHGILALHNKLAANQVKNPYIVQWRNSGANIIVLQGYNHRHLKHLEKEAKFTALGRHALYHQRYQNYQMLVLTVFGRKEEIEDIFDGMKRL